MVVPAGTPINILALDGGGVRGLSSLLILRSLMQQLKIKADWKTEPRPCEVFDLICGTSSGGLTAIMLGRLRMSVDDAIKHYCLFSKKVFATKAFGSWYRNVAGAPMYDASIMEEYVKDVVAEFDASHDRNARMEDPLDGDGCRTFVVAIAQSMADAPAIRLRSYSNVHDDNPAVTCNIWEAARATTAANTFFKPAKVGEPCQTFLDGSFSKANNPSQLAFEEVSDVFPGHPVGCFLSLGTGVQDIVAVKGNLAKIADACHRLIRNCELVADAIGKKFRTETPEGQLNPYFRFSVDRGLEKMTLDDWESEEELTGITGGYMRFDVQQAKAGRCVGVLKARADSVKAKQEEDATVT